jgi:signal transduction histidine kinase
MAAFTFLPRQFHVAVVENADEAHIGTAQWMVPAYLLLINLFVLPIAAAGLILGMGATQADSFVLQLPLMADQRWLSMLVFIGGFSAATGMILISAMTLSTMITNHLILPLIEAIPSLHPLRSYLLQWRWLSVTLFIVAGALFNRTVGESYMLVNMGLISFAAVLQFAPAIIGGLFWRQGNARGALAGLLTGFIVWLYTLLLPAFTKSGWIAPYWLDQGPFGIAILRPEGLLGFSQLDPLPHSVFWSLGLNILAYIGFSVASRASKDEQALADEFIDVLLTAERPAPMLAQENTTDLEPKLDCLNRCFSDYMSAEASATSIAQCVRSTGLEERTTVNLMEIAYLQKEAEILLAGAIGGASAHRAIQRSDLFTSAEQEELSGLYSHFLAEIQLTPEELLSKIDYYQEREQMITDHASEQARTIDRLESEVDQREQAEQALKELNEELEQRVKYRTATLRHTNEKLGETLNELISTQDKLVETEKMAALGELVAGVAHEINTPVGNSITSATYLKEVVNELNEQMEEGKLTRQGLDEIRQIIGEASDLIYTNLTRASELVSSFKQIAVDQANEAAQRFNVSRNLQQTLVSLKHNLKKAGCEVSVECDERMEIFSYPGSFVRIYTNLIMNSLIHGFEGMDDGRINIEIKQLDGQLEIRYWDNGRGIPEAIRHKIFDPFVTSKRGHGGSGLGTHIVYNLVTQLLKGSIRCESERDEGALFEIKLPLSSQVSPAIKGETWD